MAFLRVFRGRAYRVTSFRKTFLFTFRSLLYAGGTSGDDVGLAPLHLGHITMFRGRGRLKGKVI